MRLIPDASNGVTDEDVIVTGLGLAMAERTPVFAEDETDDEAVTNSVDAGVSATADEEHVEEPLGDAADLAATRVTVANFADKLNATLLALDTDLTEAQSFWTCDVDAAVTGLLRRRADAFWRIARLGSFMAENRLPLNNIHTLRHFSESDELTSTWFRRFRESG